MKKKKIVRFSIYQNILNDILVPPFKLGSTRNASVEAFLKYEKEFKRNFFKKQEKYTLTDGGLESGRSLKGSKIYYIEKDNPKSMYHFLLFALAKLTIKYNLAACYCTYTYNIYNRDSSQLKLIDRQCEVIKRTFAYFLKAYECFIHNYLFG